MSLVCYICVVVWLRIAKQRGQALPLAMMALVLAMLVIIPFVQMGSALLIISRQHQAIIEEQYANDAAVEYTIWNLTYGTLAATFNTTGDQYSYTLPVAVNGLQPSITVTASQTKLPLTDTSNTK